MRTRGVGAAAGAAGLGAPHRGDGQLVAAAGAANDLPEPGHVEGLRRDRRLAPRGVFLLLSRLLLAPAARAARPGSRAGGICVRTWCSASIGGAVNRAQIIPAMAAWRSGRRRSGQPPWIWRRRAPHRQGNLSARKWRIPARRDRACSRFRGAPGGCAPDPGLSAASSHHGLRHRHRRPEARRHGGVAKTYTCRRADGSKSAT